MSTTTNKHYTYTHKYYPHHEGLPPVVKEFAARSGFDFTVAKWYAYDYNKGSPVYHGVNRHLDNFLLWRHIKGELSAQLPLHNAGNLTILEFSTVDWGENLVVFAQVYYSLINKLRKAPLLIEQDHLNSRFRLFYKFTELVSHETWDRWGQYVKSHIGGITDFKHYLPTDSDYVDLPGAKAWPVAVVPYTWRRAFNKKPYIGETRPLLKRQEIFNTLCVKGSPLPENVKAFRTGGETAKREPLNPEDKTYTFNPNPDYYFGAGTRFQVIAKIALWSIRKNGFDFNRFCAEADAFNTGGSKDMASPQRRGAMLAEVWEWATNTYKETPPTTTTSHNEPKSAKPVSVTPATVAAPYAIDQRSVLKTTIYNPVLQQNEAFEWFYSKDFTFTPHLYETLKAALVPLAQRRGQGGGRPERFAVNALELFRVLYENTLWHRYRRRNPHYITTHSTHLGTSFDNAPVFSKEHRRKLCRALGLPQHNNLWRLLRGSGLINVLTNTTTGRTYSYQGAIRHAQHITTPGARLATYAGVLFKAIRAAAGKAQSVSPEEFSLLPETVLTTLHVNYISGKLYSKNAFDIEPSNPTNPLASNNTVNTIVTSSIDNQSCHNICVKCGTSANGVMGAHSPP